MDAIRDWKQEIIREQGKPNIRKKTIPGLAGLNNDDVLEMGNALEQMTQTKGWLIVESWIYQDSSAKRILSLKTDFERGFAAGKMNVMDQVAGMIQARNEIVAKEKEKEMRKEQQKSVDKNIDV